MWAQSWASGSVCVKETHTRRHMTAIIRPLKVKQSHMKPGRRENTAGVDAGAEGFTSHSMVTRTSRHRLHSLTVKKTGSVCEYCQRGRRGEEWKKGTKYEATSVVSFHPSLQRDTRDFNYLNLWAPQRAPPTNVVVKHTLVPTVTYLIPSNITASRLYGHKHRKSQRCTKSAHTLKKRRSEGVRGGSTHVQRVLVDDDKGHAVCHQATRVTWETQTDSGRWRRGMGGGLDLLKPKTQVKNWFHVWLDSHSPTLFSHTDTRLPSTPSASSHQHISIVVCSA